MDTLPSDLILEIAKYLDDLSILKLANLSKKLYTILPRKKCKIVTNFNFNLLKSLDFSKPKSVHISNIEHENDMKSVICCMRILLFPIKVYFYPNLSILYTLICNDFIFPMKTVYKVLKKRNEIDDLNITKYAAYCDSIECFKLVYVHEQSQNNFNILKIILIRNSVKCFNYMMQFNLDYYLYVIDNEIMEYISKINFTNMFFKLYDKIKSAKGLIITDILEKINLNDLKLLKSRHIYIETHELTEIIKKDKLKLLKIYLPYVKSLDLNDFTRIIICNDSVNCLKYVLSLNFSLTDDHYFILNNSCAMKCFHHIVMKTNLKIPKKYYKQMIHKKNLMKKNNYKLLRSALI
jgi:hypothetical protein